MKLYLKNGTILEDKKLLRDYGVNTSIHTCDHPAEVFVGFRVDPDDLTEGTLYSRASGCLDSKIILLRSLCRRRRRR